MLTCFLLFLTVSPPKSCLLQFCIQRVEKIPERFLQLVWRVPTWEERKAAHFNRCNKAGRYHSVQESCVLLVFTLNSIWPISHLQELLKREVKSPPWACYVENYGRGRAVNFNQIRRMFIKWSLSAVLMLSPCAQVMDVLYYLLCCITFCRCSCTFEMLLIGGINLTN